MLRLYLEHYNYNHIEMNKNKTFHEKTFFSSFLHVKINF